MQTMFHILFALLTLAGWSLGSDMERVSVEELSAAIGGKAAGCDNLRTGFDHVVTDSRTVRAGDLFWALRGETHDGHDFANDALRRGAAACVVRSDRAREIRGPFIVVNDTLHALWKFARWQRDRQEALVIGVTGSVGKTTTREMIHAVLSTRHRGIQSPKNYNNHVGLPLSVLDIDATHEFAVLEMGASAVGEIRDLAGIAAPEVGVVTKIGVAHLTGFGSEKQILQAKGELVEAIPPTGFVVLSGDDPKTRSLSQRANCPVILVGEGTGNNLRATAVSTEPGCVRFRVEGRNYEVPATGKHHLTAALAAMAIAREIGLTSQEVAEGLRNFAPVAGRSRFERIGPWGVIDDTYNANPSSMQAACETLKFWKGSGQRILVVGDMLELEPRTAELHRELGRQAAGSHLDYLLAFGEQSDQVVRGARESGMDPHRLAQCENLDALLATLDCWIEPGDVLLVKGSRGMRMERVLEWLQQHKEGTHPQHIARAPTRACA